MPDTQLEGYDCDGPLALPREPGIFAFAREQGLAWDYRIYAETGDWALATNFSARPVRDKVYVDYRQQRLQRCPEGWLDRPTPGANAFVASRNGRRRCVISGRALECADETVLFLKAHVGEFHFHYFGLTTKGSVLRRVAPAWFVEDNIREARRAARLGIQAFLFPVREVIRRPQEPNLVRLDAEDLVRPAMSDDAWDAVCEKAWAEIAQRLS